MSKNRGYDYTPQHQDTPLPNPNRPRYGYGDRDEPREADDVVAPRTSEEYRVPNTLKEQPGDIMDRTVYALRTDNAPIAAPEVPAPVEERPGILGTTKRKIGAAVAGATVVGVAAGALFMGGGGKRSDEPNENLPPQGGPIATASPNPGETSAPAESKTNFENYTLENFPFMIAGETVTGIEGLREKFGIDAQVALDDVPSVLAERVNEANKFGTGPEKEYYAGYVSPNGDGEGIEAVLHGFYLPAVAEIWGATKDKILVPGTLYESDYDGLEAPMQLYSMVDNAVKGNVRYPEEGVSQYTIDNAAVEMGAHGPEIKPVPGTEDEYNIAQIQSEVTLTKDGENNIVMPGLGWKFNAYRTPTGWYFGNFENQTAN